MRASSRVSRSIATTPTSSARTPASRPTRAETQGRALGLTIYGATSAENQWVVDGVNTTNISQGLQGKAINNEFVQEVEVKTGGYSAEYGGALGGVSTSSPSPAATRSTAAGFFYYDSSRHGGGPDLHVAGLRRRGDAVGRLSAARLRSGPRRLPPEGPSLVLRRVRPRDARRRRLARGAVPARLDRRPLSARLRGQPLRRQADVEHSRHRPRWSPPSSRILRRAPVPPERTRARTSGSGVSKTRPSSTPIRRPGTHPVNSAAPTSDYALTRLLGSDGPRHAPGLSPPGRQQPDGRRREFARVDLRCTGETPGTPDLPCQPPDVPNVRDRRLRRHRRASRPQRVFPQSASRPTSPFTPEGTSSRPAAAMSTAAATRRYSVTGGQEVSLRNEFGQTYYDHFFAVRSVHDLTPVAGVKFRAKARSFGAYVQDSWRPSPGLTLNLGLRWDSEDLLTYQGAHRICSAQRVAAAPRRRVGSLERRKDEDLRLRGPLLLRAPDDRDEPLLSTTSPSFTRYNFDPTSIAQDPGVMGHEVPFCEFGCGATGDGTDRFDYVDHGAARESYQDEFTFGVERALDPTLTVALKGTYRTSRQRDRGPLRLRRRRARRQRDGLRDHQSRAPARSSRSGDAPVCNGLDDPYYACAPTGPASPAARRLYRGIELVARKSVGEHALACRRATSTRRFAATTTAPSTRRSRTRHPASIRTSTGRRTGTTPTGVSSSIGLTAFDSTATGSRRSDSTVGLQAFAASGPPFDQIGYVGTSMTYLVPRGSAGRLPTQWDANLSLSYPIDLRPCDRHVLAYVFNVFNNQIPTSQTPFWTLGEADGYPTRSTTRIRSRTTRTTASTPAARRRASSARRCASASSALIPP